MAIVSIVEATRLTGKSRATIYRDFEKGKLSRETLHNGRPGVDVSELSRVYGAFKSIETSDTVSLRQNDALRDTAILEEKIRSLESQLKHKDEMAMQLQARINDKEYIIVELQTKVLMIEYLTPTPLAEEEKIRPKAGFWSRLMGVKQE